MEREPAPTSVKRSSASRYWKARLQVLKRPAVWGSGLLLLLPLIFLGNYWRNPEGFVGSQALIQLDRAAPPDNQNALNSPDEGRTPNPAVSDASTLLEVPALPDQATGEGQSSEGTQPTLLDTLLSPPLPLLEAELPQLTSRSRNPFATQSRNSEAAQSRTFNRASTSNGADSGLSPLLPSLASSSPLLSSALAQSANSDTANSTTQSNQAVLPLNPLQSALDRSAGIATAGSQSPSEAEAEPQANLNAQAAPSTGQTLPWLVPTGQFARPLGTPTLGTSTYIPQTSPFPGTTGYTLPSALRPTVSPYYSSYPNYANSYFNGAYTGGYAGAYTGAYTGYPINPYAGFPGSITPGYSTLPQVTPALPISPYSRTPGYSTGVPVPTFNTPATTSFPQPVPFSIPRTPPGRYIGGGEINTFSNP